MLAQTTTILKSTGAYLQDYSRVHLISIDHVENSRHDASFNQHNDYYQRVRGIESDRIAVIRGAAVSRAWHPTSTAYNMENDIYDFFTAAIERGRSQ